MVRNGLGRRVAALCLVGLAVQVAPAGAVWGVAQAAQRPKVALVPFTALEAKSTDAAAKLSLRLQAELSGKQADVELIGGAQADSKSRSTSSGSPEARKLMEDGRNQLGDLQFDAAATSLRRGIELSLSDVASAELPAVLEAQVNLAVALFRKGEEKEAQTTLFTVARLAPDYALPEGKFPPVFIREFEKARKRAASAPKGSLGIEGPRGATAFIDGRDLGMVPLQEDDLSSGPHFVQVVGVNGERFGQRVEVSKGVTRVKAQFVAAPAPAAALAFTMPAVVDAKTLSRLGELARSAGADELVVGVLSPVEEGHAVGVALYTRKENALRRLDSAPLDAKLEQVSAAAYVLGGQIVERINSPGRADAPPVTLIPGAQTKVAAIETGPRASDTPKKEADRVVMRPGGEGRALDRTSVLDLDAEPDAEVTTSPRVSSGGLPWWVWVAGGIGAAAVAGGAFYGLSQAGRPVTGTVTARW